MRKITEQSIEAFNAGMPFKKQNMEVSFLAESIKLGFPKSDHWTVLSLHGNVIAMRDGDRLFITNAGWASNTTKERLNALPDVNIYQKEFIWYLNGDEWNGEMVEIRNGEVFNI